jgi:hypothetical protein
MKIRLLAALLAALASFPLHAQDPSQCSAATPGFCLNGVGNAVTALDALRIGARGPRSGREEEDSKEPRAAYRRTLVASTRDVGLGADEPWAVWGSYGRSEFSGSVPVAPYSAELDSVRAGIDRLFAGRYALGLSVIGERLETRTRYNGGGQDVDGLMVAPYLTVLFGQSFSLDLVAGWGKSDATQTRIEPTGPTAGAILRSEYDAERSFASATLNAFKPLGDFTLGGRLGYLYTREEQDGYQETGGTNPRTVSGRRVLLGQLFAGIDAAYRFANNLEPNAGLVFRRDATRKDGREGGGLPAAVGATQPDDRNEWEWTMGLRWFGPRGITLMAEYLKTEGRDQFENKSLDFLARFEF